MRLQRLSWFFMFFLGTDSERHEKHHKSLNILTPLKNSTYKLGKRNINLICKVENATSYTWYKDGKPLSHQKIHGILVKRNSLTIRRRFKQKDTGVYKCEGKADSGLTGETVAFIRKEDPSCGPQTDLVSECVPFHSEKCPDINSFAPKAEDLKASVKVIGSSIQNFTIKLNVTWTVPKQGRSSIWGWQIRLLGLDNIPGYQMCYQINTKDPLEWDDIEYHVPVPQPLSTYMVEVEGLPSLDEPFLKTVVRQKVKIPSACVLLNSSSPCCKSYLNASLGKGKNNRTTLFWRALYPASLNVSIASFILRWVSQPNDRCNAYAVIVEPDKSNYTFSNLTASCGNYSIGIEVSFSDSSNTGCEVSPRVTLWYKPPVILNNTSLPPHPKRPRNSVVATVGFSISASVVGALIVALIILYRRWRGTKEKPKCINQFNNNDRTKVFIVHSNHCSLCTDVVHRLGSLLIETGHINCHLDMFVPSQQKSQGPVAWAEKMIKESDYVIITWMSEIIPPTEVQTVQDIEASIFSFLLDIIRGELLQNPNNKAKFIPVYLDHCSVDVLPPNQRVLQTYKIPSKIDDLIMELIGKTRRQPDPNHPILQIDDKMYVKAKQNLKDVVDKFKTDH